MDDSLLEEGINRLTNWCLLWMHELRQLAEAPILHEELGQIPFKSHTVDGRNPKSVCSSLKRWLKPGFLNGGAGFRPSTVTE